MNQTFPFEVTVDGDIFNINWNGISSSVSPKDVAHTSPDKAFVLATQLNSSAELIKNIEIVPHKRGFFKPNYTVVPPSPTPTTEDEVASSIISDANLAPRISAYLEEIVGRDFRLHTPPGTSTAFFLTTEKKSRTPSLLVNDGYGVNQVVYLLAKILHTASNTILIEEPEIHLHPTLLRSFTRQLCNIIRDEKKQLIFTTHSEQVIASLLTLVAEGRLTPDDVHVYFAEKPSRETRLRHQSVNKHGQLDGGLVSFVDAELPPGRAFDRCAGSGKLPGP
ncbi:MAG: hypothetical protein KatS3mg110_2208 [Pirellulaceae bacterium]|nr:MAG: hypothetical protein KatS3mg110_2208 [Pirellulaceae bacterium]